MPNNQFPVPDFLQVAKEIRKTASRYAASESIKFFQDSFVKEGFTDSSFTPWPKTSNPLAGKRTMYRYGKLMQSFRKRTVTMDRIVVEADSQYADIHNSGGSITVTRQMQRYWWAQYYKYAGQLTYNVNKKRMANTKKNRTNNNRAEFCKAMALMKVGTKINIPQRQFMGHSETMMAQFDKFVRDNAPLIFKQHLNDKQNGSLD